jgi:hypothetical protein
MGVQANLFASFSCAHLAINPINVIINGCILAIHNHIIRILQIPLLTYTSLY